MTSEEAIRRVECCRDFLANNYSDMGELNYMAFNMAIEALQKQKAKVKQKDVERYRYEDSPRYTGYTTYTEKAWICCNCNKEINHKDVFCRHCGAQLKWKN